ncbi:MAG: PorV/PorQ family protein [Elusimicrobia bacterium]|nr:PorV/PorQ family protein [Elusimicrobiota bacterium]
MRPRAAVAAVAATLSLSNAAFADNSGTTAAPVLQLPLGARAQGMGSAFTGLADDISTLYYNPGGLSTLNHREATFMYMRGLDGQSVEYIAGGTPIPFYAGLLGLGYASVGGSLLFSQNGDILVNQTRPDGSFLDSRTISAGSDLVASMTYSERVAQTDFENSRATTRMNHFVGVTAKIIRSTLAEQYSATAFAGDFGYLVKLPDHGWTFGLAALNAGSRMTFVTEGDPLPLTLRGGAAYQMKDAMDNTVRLVGDGGYLYYERNWLANIGVEYLLIKDYAVRFGYRLHDELAGFTMGFGYSWQNFYVDYSWGLSSEIEDTHRLSFSYKFGKVTNPEREKPRRPYMQRSPETEEYQNLDEMKPKVEKKKRRRIESERGAPGWIY